MEIPTIVVDSTSARTPLCSLGAMHGTDKSPYTENGPGHRHPYTAAYHILFSALRTRDIVFGELGILDNSSMRMWRDYFPRARLYGFDFDEELVKAARAERLPMTEYSYADVSAAPSMFEAFNAVGAPFDVLIDDSTHLFDHQMQFVDAAIDFVKPGGMIIVEDVFRGWPNERYGKCLAPYASFIDAAFFMDTKNEQGFSGGTQEPYFDNDKILVLCRSGEPRPARGTR